MIDELGLSWTTTKARTRSNTQICDSRLFRFSSFRNAHHRLESRGSLRGESGPVSAVLLQLTCSPIPQTRNIGNQYLIDSLSTESVFSYAISHLGVSHLIVLGHTKCGAVLASIVPESKATMDDIGENRIMVNRDFLPSFASSITDPSFGNLDLGSTYSLALLIFRSFRNRRLSRVNEEEERSHS